MRVGWLVGGWNRRVAKNAALQATPRQAGQAYCISTITSSIVNTARNAGDKNSRQECSQYFLYCKLNIQYENEDLAGRLWAPGSDGAAGE